MISESPGKREETKQNKGQKWADDTAHPINGCCPAVALRFFLPLPPVWMDGHVSLVTPGLPLLVQSFCRSTSKKRR